MSERQEKVIPTSLPEFGPLTARLSDRATRQWDFFTQLAHQVNEWSTYNFGDQVSHRPALGMIEELNELQMALNRFDRAGVLDAIGDITIYMADYHAKRSWDMGSTWGNRCSCSTSIEEQTSVLSRWLAHYQLKGEQGIRGGSSRHEALMVQTCSEVLWYCLSVSNFLGVDYLECISKVWSDVSKRDWRKNKDTAHTVAESTQEVVKDLFSTPGMAAASTEIVEGIANGTIDVGVEGNPSYEVGDDDDDDGERA